MSETIVLSGIYEPVSLAETAVSVIRSERARSPELSRFEHDIISGIENDLTANNGELGFVATASAIGAGLVAAEKAGALKKVGNFFDKVGGKLKSKIQARRAKRGGKSDPQENGVFQTITNISAQVKAEQAKYGAIAQSEAFKNSTRKKPPVSARAKAQMRKTAEPAEVPAPMPVYAPVYQQAEKPALDPKLLALGALALLLLMKK